MDLLLKRLKKRRRPFTESELCEFLGVSRRTLYSHRKRELIEAKPAPHDARAKIYTIEAVQAYLEAKAGVTS